MKYHVYRSVIALLFSICILLQPIHVFAAEGNDEPQLSDLQGEIITVNHIVERELSADEVSLYAKYDIDIPKLATASSMSNITNIENILQFCNPTEEYSIDTMQITEYTSNALSQYLYECKSVEGLFSVDNVLYITYIASNGAEVYLCYNEHGLASQVIYFPENDKAIIQEVGSIGKQVDGFRTGYTSGVSDKLLSEIDHAIDIRDYDFLNKVKMLTNNSSVYSERTPIYASAAKLYGFRSDEEMLKNLKDNFPEIYDYDDDAKDFRIYSQWIDRTCDARVYQTRNNYIRITSNYSSFAAKTTINVIRAFLGVLENSTVIGILTRMGVGIISAAVPMIAEQVKLYNTARYRFTGGRDGYVYDQYGHEDYVHVVFDVNRGEFTGGYAPSGEFTWVMSLIPHGLQVTDESVANNAVDLYAKDVFANGYCTMYWPDNR